MKKLMFLFSMMLICTGAFTQSLADLDAKNGFRDVHFGMHTSEFDDLILTEEKGDLAFSRRTTDVLTIGNFELQELGYGFYKGTLFAVMISTNGLTNSRGVLQTLQAAYGKGTKPNRFIERYLWIGAKVSMMYEENSITNDATVLIISIAISDQKERDEKRAIQESTKDL